MEKLGLNPAWLIAQYMSVILIVAFLGVVGLFILWLARSSGFISRNPTPRETPLDILKARYARGELSREQFEQMRKDMEA